MPESRARQDDLFASEPDTRAAIAPGSPRAERGPEDAQNGSIEWYAKRQAELYRQGLESASAYWLTKHNVRWP